MTKEILTNLRNDLLMWIDQAGYNLDLFELIESGDLKVEDLVGEASDFFHDVLGDGTEPRPKIETSSKNINITVYTNDPQASFRLGLIIETKGYDVALRDGHYGSPVCIQAGGGFIYGLDECMRFAERLPFLVSEG